MLLKISPRNSKIGDTPNFSLPPGVSCVPDVPCFTEGCYALNCYRRFKNTRKAWDSNLDLYKSNPDTFFKDLHEWLCLHRPVRFRVFVGGDFPDESFWYRFCRVAIGHYDVKFLIFTKRYDYNYTFKPHNVQIILSVWPGLELPTNTDLPWAWLAEDPRRPQERPYIMCPGGCGKDQCGHKCWGLVSPEVPVVFEKH